MSITVENITKTYGNQKALDSVSFTIEKGEVVGFLDLMAPENLR